MDRYTDRRPRRRRPIPLEKVHHLAMMKRAFQVLHPRELFILFMLQVKRVSQESLTQVLSVYQSNISYRKDRVQDRIKLFFAMNELTSETQLRRELIELGLGGETEERRSGPKFVPHVVGLLENLPAVLGMWKTSSQTDSARHYNLNPGSLRYLTERTHAYLQHHQPNSLALKALTLLGCNYNRLKPFRSQSHHAFKSEKIGATVTSPTQCTLAQAFQIGGRYRFSSPHKGVSYKSGGWRCSIKAGERYQYFKGLPTEHHAGFLYNHLYAMVHPGRSGPNRVPEGALSDEERADLARLAEDRLSNNHDQSGGYKGVTFQRSRYVANLTHAGSRAFLGSYPTPELAGYSYNCGFLLLFGPSAPVPNPSAGSPGPEAYRRVKENVELQVRKYWPNAYCHELPEDPWLSEAEPLRTHPPSDLRPRPPTNLSMSEVACQI